MYSTFFDNSSSEPAELKEKARAEKRKRHEKKQGKQMQNGHGDYTGEKLGTDQVLQPGGMVSSRLVICRSIYCTFYITYS